MALALKDIDLIETGKYIDLKITGKLEKSDYDLLVPELEAQIDKFGPVNLMVELIDFHGWTAGAAWADAKFGIKHFNDIKRIAVVGDKNWEKGMSIFLNAFVKAKVRYFDVSERDEAFVWMVEVGD